MPARDPAHWLFRLTAAEWLAAADNELARARAALAQRSTRTGITHARRAAGMAWNAVLVGAPDDKLGRSYMDHVTALAGDDAQPEPVRAAARLLRDTPPRPLELVTIGRPDLSAADAAGEIIEHARRRAQLKENG